MQRQHRQQQLNNSLLFPQHSRTLSAPLDVLRAGAAAVNTGQPSTSTRRQLAVDENSCYMPVDSRVRAIVPCRVPTIARKRTPTADCKVCALSARARTRAQTLSSGVGISKRTVRPTIPPLLDTPTTGDATPPLIPACSQMHQDVRDLLVFSDDSEDEKLLVYDD